MLPPRSVGLAHLPAPWRGHCSLQYAWLASPDAAPPPCVFTCTPWGRISRPRVIGRGALTVPARRHTMGAHRSARNLRCGLCSRGGPRLLPVRALPPYEVRAFAPGSSLRGLIPIRGSFFFFGVAIWGSMKGGQGIFRKNHIPCTLMHVCTVHPSFA